MGKIKRIIFFLLIGILLITLWVMDKTPQNLLMGVIAVILLILLFIFLIFRAAKAPPSLPEVAAPLPPPPEEEPAEEAASAAYESSRSKLRKSFGKAIRSLKNNVSGRDYRYQIPWFLMLGEAGAGKSEVLKHIGLTPLIDRRIEKYREDREADCNWWLFEQGVIIDVAGKMLFREDEEAFEQRIGRFLPGRFREQLSGSRMWRYFLSLLQRYRPDRPIDGIILTLPCTDLIGFGGEPHEIRRIQDKADLLYRRIWHAQKVLGIRFPVYILVTQCDRLGGFQDFCQALPAAHLSDHIFGWSSPYTVDTAYARDWGQQAFRSVRQQLFETRFEMFAEGVAPERRDDFFLFPDNFQALEKPLRLYLDHLFRQSVYHQSFVFRGLYFSGHGQPEETETSPARPFFVKELFGKKIFPEHGIARPLARAIITRNRKDLAFQVLTILFVLVAGIGLWRDYGQFRKDHRAVRSFLQKVDENLDDLSVGIRTNNKMELVRYVLEQEAMSIPFNENALRLSSELANVNELRFTFIPSSWLWFSSVHNRIRDSVRSAYDQIILKAMFIQLVQKAETIVEPQHMGRYDPGDQTFPWSIEEIPAFYDLSRFTRDIRELEKYIAMYNGLSTSRNYLDDFGQVVAYLFGVRLRESFYVRSSYYAHARKEAERWTFDPEITRIFRVKASQFTIDKLAYRFLEDFPRSGEVDRQLQSLAAELEEFSQRGTGTIRDDRPIRRLLEKISDTEGVLVQDRHQWLARQRIEQVEPFARLIADIGKSAFLGEHLSRKILGFGQKGFRELREGLKRRQASVTGPLLARQDNEILMRLSDKVGEFKAGLAKLLGYDFMNARQERFRDVRTCPAGTRLEWNINLLRDTVASLEEYERFIRSEYREYSESLQQMVIRVAKSRMDKEVQGRVAGAQSCESLSDRFLRQHKEAVVASEILNFKDASKLLTRIRSDCGRLDLMDAYVVLSELLRWQADHLLTSVDAILRDENLYSVRGDDFSWWDGKRRPPLSLTAFDVVDQEELAYYLQLQRNRIRHLAYEYAEPVITLFLSNQMDDLVLNRWKRILGELQAHEHKKPGNSVNALEKFILFEMDHVNEINFRQKLAPARIPGESGDIFLEKKNRLVRKLYEQCQRLSADTLMADYTAVRGFFNQKLAGRFPFANLTAGQARFAETEPEDIRDFYRLLDGRLAFNRDLLAQDHLFGISGGHVRDFLARMETVRPVFSGYLDEPAPEMPVNGGKGEGTDGGETGQTAENKNQDKDSQLNHPALDFDIRFRVNRKHEQLANRIMEWQFRVGDQVFRYGEEKKTGRWHWGNPVSLSLRWPRNYPGYPVLPGERPGLTLDGKTVTYTFDNRWSLLRLLKLHAASPGDFDTPEENVPHTLRFEASTVHVDLNKQKKDAPAKDAPPNTLAFIRLTLVTPDKHKKELVLPTFPVTAPELKWAPTDGGIDEQSARDYGKGIRATGYAGY